ncbi:MULTISPECIES: hypothetical protein [Rhodobacterales]|uniref:hypothetical protein n=1 Tax=Rhodobacterales TaxID=204455 RepID=UPI0011BE1BA9|nr:MULTISPECIES: hypothetical protein [Rhodobacterales]MDO6589397.1 hypothetical protein [Yoonia sp. 1_MG-2023]
MDDLDTVFIQNSGGEDGYYHPICSVEEGKASLRLLEQYEERSSYEMMTPIMLTLQHFMGGIREDGIEIIANSAETHIKDTLENLPIENLPVTFNESLRKMGGEVDEIIDGLRDVDFEGGWGRIDPLVKEARHGDPMRDMHPIQKVDFLISLLSDKERQGFVETYPKNFAANRLLENGELAGFALALFGMGLTKNKGEFTGRKQREFRSQLRDTQHIEEASRCEVFVTFDKEAAKLARSVFAYAGFATEVVLLAHTQNGAA